jgi:hypothetical protein
METSSMTNYDQINFMLPTRKRVPQLRQFITSSLANVTSFNRIAFTFLVDKDDYQTRYYLDKTRLPCDSAVLLWDEPTPHLGKMYNKLYRETPFKDAVVSMVGDDMEWMTPSYNEPILNAINDLDGFAVVSCNDSYIQQGKIFVNLFTTRRMVEATGAPFMSEEFPMDFIDVVWTELARHTKTEVYLSEVILKHCHSTCAGDDTRERLRAVRGKAGLRRAMEIGRDLAVNVLEAIENA